MSQMIVKTHYSAAELAAMVLPGMPSTKVAIRSKAERESWPYTETTGIGGTRREYAPPPEIMAAIKEFIVNHIISGGTHESEAAIDEGNSPKPCTHAAQGVHGQNGEGAASHAQSEALAANDRQEISRPVVLLPGKTQQTQPVQHGIAPAPQERVHGTIGPVNTEAGAVRVQAAALKDWQKRTAEARVALLREVERISQVVGREKAIMKVVIMAQDGTLPEPLAQLVPVANARAGRDGKRTLCRRTIYDWFKAYQPGNVTAVNALAPKDQHAVMRIPEWAPDLLAAYQMPQKPSLSWAVEQIAGKHGIDEQTLYHRARRFLQKMGNVEREAGRMGARALKNIKPFVRRDSSMLWPADVYSADGHTFDAEVAHPAHGKPFRPEITSVRDLSSRKLVGWSVDLAESGLAVLDALRHACETGGICSLFYVDHGSGFDNALQSAPGIGMESRLGYTKTHSLPYNSQARGVVEKGHKDIWVRAAKELPTYMGADMDAEAKNKVFKLTRADIKENGSSKHLMSWQTFLEFVRHHAEKYNNRPHRSLKKIYDPALGKKRHMTPNEAWDEGVKEGAQLVTITPDESRELFRPMKESKVLRGEIRLFNNLYFSKDLTEYHGEIMRVAYDIHNAETVWVYDQQGRFVCSAGFEANKRAYFPDSVLEQAARKRAKGRLSRVEAKAEEIRQELQGAPLKDVTDVYPALENNASPTLRLVGDLETVCNVVDVEAVEVSSDARPIFMLESDRYEWLMQHRDAWTDKDRRFLRDFLDDPQGYAQLSERFELLGLAWAGDTRELLEVAVSDGMPQQAIG